MPVYDVYFAPEPDVSAFALDYASAEYPGEFADGDVPEVMYAEEPPSQFPKGEAL